MLYIFRRTYGWQKEMDCISLSQFEHGIVTKRGRRLDYGTGLARSSINDALKSIVNQGYVLRYIAGRGSQRRSYFFLNTEEQRKTVRGLECGQLTIAQLLGRKFKPSVGRNSEPSSRVSLGRNFGTTRQRKQKTEGQKKGDYPPDPELRREDSDAAERHREQRLTSRRLSER